MHAWKKALTNLGLLFCSVVIFLLVSEIFFLIPFPPPSQKDDSNSIPWQTKYFPLNFLGYRGRELSFKKPDNVFRILALGDSQTFGQGIYELGNTWPKKLETRLNEGQNSTTFEVINLSFMGWNTDTQLYRLFEEGFEFNPDMVLLAFYPNDVPTPAFFHCENKDRHILPDGFLFDGIKRHSKVYDFMKFRGNRLLEKLGAKPTYADCMNRRYEKTRAWDMEKVYLNAMALALQIKNVHFAMTAIPVLFKLEKDYPLQLPLNKVSDYCREKNLLFLDLYETGFKGKQAAELVISEKDRHLNEKGADIVANVLYSKLEPLKSYRRLLQFNKAFDLKTILDKDPLAMDLDRHFDELASNKKLVLQQKSKDLIVEASGTGLAFQIKENDYDGEGKKRTSRTELDREGNFVRKEKIVDQIKNGENVILTETVSLTDEGYLSEFNVKQKTDSLLINRALQKNLFLIRPHREKDKLSLTLEPNISFPDPKVFEANIFNPKFSPSRDLTDNNRTIAEMRASLETLFKANPFLGNSGELSRMSESQLGELLDELYTFEILMVYKRYGAGDYVNKLAEEAFKLRPEPLYAVKAVKRYQALNISPFANFDIQ